MSAVAYFSAGPKKKIGENGHGGDVIYSPNGWITDDGTITLCISQDVTVEMTDDGRCKVWYEGRRVL